MFRVYVRIKSFHKIYADDFLVLLAWLIFLANTIIWHTQQKYLYTQLDSTAGNVAFTPEASVAIITVLRKLPATRIMFPTCLWILKLSCLIFFRRLDQKVRGHKIWWWCVLIFTIVTWATCIGDIRYQCLLGSLQYTLSTRPSYYPNAKD